MSRGMSFGMSCKVTVAQAARRKRALPPGVLIAPDYEVARILEQVNSRPNRTFDVVVDDVPLTPASPPLERLEGPSNSQRETVRTGPVPEPGPTRTYIKPDGMMGPATEGMTRGMAALRGKEGLTDDVRGQVMGFRSYWDGEGAVTVNRPVAQPDWNNAAALAAAPPTAGRARLEWLIEQDQQSPAPDLFAGFPGMRSEPVRDTGGMKDAGLTDYESRATQFERNDPNRVAAAMDTGDINAGRTPEMVARDDRLTAQADRMAETAAKIEERRFTEGWVPWYKHKARTPQDKAMLAPLTETEIDLVRYRYQVETDLFEQAMTSQIPSGSPEVVRQIMAREMQRARYDVLADSLIAEVKLERLNRITSRGVPRQEASTLGPDAPLPDRSFTMTDPIETGYAAGRAREKARKAERLIPRTDPDIQTRADDMIQRRRTPNTSGPFDEPYAGPQTPAEWALVETFNKFRMRRDKETREWRARPGQAEFTGIASEYRTYDSIDYMTGEPVRRSLDYTPSKMRTEDPRKGQIDPMVGDRTEAAPEVVGRSGPGELRRQADDIFEKENGRPPRNTLEKDKDGIDQRVYEGGDGVKHKAIIARIVKEEEQPKSSPRGISDAAGPVRDPYVDNADITLGPAEREMYDMTRIDTIANFEDLFDGPPTTKDDWDLIEQTIQFAMRGDE